MRTRASLLSFTIDVACQISAKPYPLSRIVGRSRMAGEFDSSAADLQWVISVAVSGTVLEMLQRSGMSTVGAINVILAVLAALLLPAAAMVPLIARRVPTEPASLPAA
jgi:hypothetical protein